MLVCQRYCHFKNGCPQAARVSTFVYTTSCDQIDMYALCAICLSMDDAAKAFAINCMLAINGLNVQQSSNMLNPHLASVHI